MSLRALSLDTGVSGSSGGRSGASEFDPNAIGEILDVDEYAPMHSHPWQEDAVGEEEEEDTSPPEWDPSINSVEAGRDSLPQPYRMITQLLESIVDGAWESILSREAMERGRPRPSFLDSMGDDDDDEGEGGREKEREAAARVQHATQPPIHSRTDLPVALPTRIIAPVAPARVAPVTQVAPVPAAAAGGKERSAAHSITASPAVALVAAATSEHAVGAAAPVQASCIATSLDGKVGAMGSASGQVVLLDLARHSAPFMLDAAAGAATRVTALALTPAPIVRGDEDLHGGDEADNLFNYVLAWTSAAPSVPTGPAQAQTLRVITLNAHHWTVYEGCSMSIPPRSLPTPAGVVQQYAQVTSLQLSPDASHVVAVGSDGVADVFALRPHRYDPRLEPPKKSQKELLSDAKLAAAAAQSIANANIMGGSAGGPLDLTAIFSDADFTPGVAEQRTITTLQPKLYTATPVLQVAPPRWMQERELQRMRAARSASRAAQSAESAAAGGAVSGPPQSVSPVPGKSKTMAAPAAVQAKPSSPLPSDSLSWYTPPSYNLSLYFLHPPRDRALGRGPSFATRGLIACYEGDTGFRRWDLRETQPVLPATGPLPTSQAAGPTAGANASNVAPPATAKRRSNENLTPASQPVQTSALHPPSASFVLPAPLSASCIDFSTRFLALCVEDGSTLLYDAVLGTMRGVLSSTPSLGHSVSSWQQTRITCAAFYEQTHLVLGSADHTLRCFFLPANLTKPCRRDELEACSARISARLPAPPVAIHAGSKVPLAIVSVGAPASASSSTGGSTVQELFVYDLASNFVLGRMHAGSSLPRATPRLGGFSPSSTSASWGAATDEFAVHNAMSAASTMRTTVEEKEEHDAFSSRSVVPPLRTFTSSGGLVDASVRGSARGFAGHNSPAVEGLHPLTRGVQATLDGEQLMLLARGPGGSALLACYPLSDLLTSLYPAMAAECPNAYLRQQHAIGWMRAMTHRDRQKAGSWQRYMASLDAAVAGSNRRQLHTAYEVGRSVVSTGRRGHSRTGSRAGSAALYGSGSAHRKTPSGRYSSKLSQITSGGESEAASRVSTSPRASSLASSAVHSRVPSASAFSGSLAPGHTRRVSQMSNASGRSHARSASRDRVRRDVLANLLPPESLPVAVPRDAAFVVHATLMGSSVGSGLRADLAKTRRAELGAQVKQQAREAQRHARMRDVAAPAAALTLPPIARTQQLVHR